MIKLFDLVKVNTATSGTGTITFGTAFSNAFLTPSEAGCADGDHVRYVIVDGTDVEVGEGVIGGSVTTMSRTVVFSKVGGTKGTSALNLSGTAYLAFTAIAADIYTAPTTIVLTSGSGTYTPPAAAKWIRVRMVGGGGGGAGGGSTDTTGGTGGDTTFGAHTAAGGVPGAGIIGGRGGSFTIGAGANGFGFTGQGGEAGASQTTVNGVIGGSQGGSSMLGGGAFGVSYSSVGASAANNSGGGGGGGGTNNVVGSQAGGGGGAGGGVDIVIHSPSASYSYSVGAGGTAAAAGTSGRAGGAGGSGIIIVDEYYG